MQICKLCSGGGKTNKSLAHNHFASRNGVYDEFGIDFDNEAVLDISPPILAIEAPHSDAQNRNEPYSLLWHQYMLLDANGSCRRSHRYSDPSAGRTSESETHHRADRSFFIGN